MIVKLGIEFVGYYTVDGPNGFVVSGTKEQAIQDAKTLTEDWPNSKFGEPYHQKNKRNWTVVIWV